MSASRKLPERHNPLLEAAHTPNHEILIERRRLGQTDLAVKSGHANVNNATSEKNLGKFDYAHLRAPLPKDLKDSGIFSLQKGVYPESYFLMRRSSDGFVSATGMFKAAFPWASYQEEVAERRHHKALNTVGAEEVAGNVWLSPEQALELADEYDMRAWILALLDPEPIEKGTREKGNVATPPRFNIKDLSASSAMGSRRLRSQSPVKQTAAASTPARKIATPRKPRTARKKKDSEGGALENGTKASIGGSVEPESVNGELVPSQAPKTGTVTVTIDQEVAESNGVETKETHVQIEMPAGNPELPLPEDPQAMIETAKTIVEKANEIKGKQASAVKSLKRKADDVVDAEDEEATRLEIQPVKKVRKLEEEVKRRTVQTRAFIGVATVTFLGAAVTYFL